jgi:hypothetical protein
MSLCLVSRFIYCYAECHYAECRYAGCRYAECRYARCRYAECRGACKVSKCNTTCRNAGANVMKLDFLVTYEWVKQVSVFVLRKSFHPGLMIAGKARAHRSGASFRCLPASPGNIVLGCKDLL